MTTYLGIDATNWVHQLWHARGGRGVVGAVVDRAVALIAELQPAATVCCFDRRSFRHDLSPGYKAGRKEKPQDLVADLQEAERQLAELGTIAAEEGAEADDCLATLAAWGKRAGGRVILATPDKDLRQCLGGQVLILRSFATEAGRPCRAEWYTDRTLFDDYGLDPWQWVDFQALVGDRGDNVDGCPGWGEKTTAKALEKCKTLSRMVLSPFDVPCSNKQRNALLKWAKEPRENPQADLAWKLVSLRTDVSSVWEAMR